MKNCDQIHVQLNAFVDDELSAVEWVRVVSHLLRCPSCRKRVKEYRRISRAATIIRVSSSDRNRKTVFRLVAASATCAAIVCLVAWKVWYVPKSPQALVYSQKSLTGNPSPTSAIYTEGDQMVVRDAKSGKVLASTPGRTRRDAFIAVSLASNVALGEPKPFLLPTKPSGQKFVTVEDKDVVLLMVEPPDGGSIEPTESVGIEPSIVFFTGAFSNLERVTLPDEPLIFVQILDPQFIIDPTSVKSFDIFVPPPNKSKPSNNR